MTGVFSLTNITNSTYPAKQHPKHKPGGIKEPRPQKRAFSWTRQFSLSGVSVLFLEEDKVAALGEFYVHRRPGYGADEILFDIIQQFSLGLHRPVAERVRVSSAGRTALGGALERGFLFGEGEGQGTDSQKVRRGPCGSFEGSYLSILFLFFLFSGIVLGAGRRGHDKAARGQKAE